MHCIAMLQNNHPEIHYMEKLPHKMFITTIPHEKPLCQEKSGIEIQWTQGEAALQWIHLLSLCYSLSL